MWLDLINLRESRERESSENNADPFTIKISLRQKEVVLNINIGSSSLKQLLPIKPPDNCSDRQS
jgi:hypothetical protein